MGIFLIKSKTIESTLGKEAILQRLRNIEKTNHFKNALINAHFAGKVTQDSFRFQLINPFSDRSNNPVIVGHLIDDKGKTKINLRLELPPSANFIVFTAICVSIYLGLVSDNLAGAIAVPVMCTGLVVIFLYTGYSSSLKESEDIIEQIIKGN